MGQRPKVGNWSTTQTTYYHWTTTTPVSISDFFFPRVTNILEPCGALAAPEEQEHVLRHEGGLETRRTAAGRVGGRGKWRMLLIVPNQSRCCKYKIVVLHECCWIVIVVWKSIQTFIKFFIIIYNHFSLIYFTLTLYVISQTFRSSLK